MAQRRIFTGLTAIFCAAAVMAAGCGYRFAGSGGFPAGVKTVFIALLDNRTTETGIEKVFTDDLIDEFIRRNEEGVAADPEGADAVLSGTIAYMSVETISRTGASTTDERRVTMTVTLKLSDRKKRVVWSSSVSENEAYPVGRGPVRHGLEPEGGHQGALQAPGRKGVQPPHRGFLNRQKPTFWR